MWLSGFESLSCKGKDGMKEVRVGVYLQLSKIVVKWIFENLKADTIPVSTSKWGGCRHLQTQFHQCVCKCRTSVVYGLELERGSSKLSPSGRQP